MPRREQKKSSFNNNVNEILCNFKKLLFEGSPLWGIANQLLADFSFILNCESLDGSTKNFIIEAFKVISDSIPQKFNDPFYFNSILVKEILNEWENGIQKFSSPLIPNFGTEWAHSKLSIPILSNGKSQQLSYIYFPDQNEKQDIDLLRYPFLFHELGHNLVFFDDSFSNKFIKNIQPLIRNLKLKSIADNGKALKYNKDAVENLVLFWGPVSNQKNWSHEILMDLIALWACGPAYLEAFVDELEDEILVNQKDPFYISNDHPPYSLRVDALIEASNQIGLGDYCISLKKLKNEIRNTLIQKNDGENRVDNRFKFLTNNEILNICILTCLDFCHSMSIPKCTNQKITKSINDIKNGELPGLGTDSIIGAWAGHKFLPKVEFEALEKRIIENHLQ